MRYVPHTDEDRAEMLAAIGVDSIEQLFEDIPSDLRLKAPLNIPRSLDEHQLYRKLSEMADKNQRFTCFLGAGIYEHFVPAALGAILSRGEFLTSYTPYQPELSQGYLQSIYEYQSMVCALTGMDMANASMYDAGTALAEAALLAHGSNGRQKVVASAGIHPHYRQIVRTFCWSTGLTYEEVPLADGATSAPAVAEDVACVLFQYPNFLGVIEDAGKLIDAAHTGGALAICCSDPIALGVLRPAGELGADVVVGEGQPLGNAMGYGGPLLGMFAVKEAFVRRLPGRIVGVTQDMEGKRGYVMTLRTREQDIRREKATSNICTNQALIALAACVYMSSLGKTGLRSVAETCVQKAHYAANRLAQVRGVKLKWTDKRYAFEFVLELPKPAAAVRDALLAKGVLGGLPLAKYYSGMDNCLLTCVTEVRTKDEIDWFAEALKEVLA